MKQNFLFLLTRVFHSEDIKFDPMHGLTATTRNEVTRKGEQKDEEDIRCLRRAQR